jgi:type 1 glutamine amidotransferase
MKTVSDRPSGVVRPLLLLACVATTLFVAGCKSCCAQDAKSPKRVLVVTTTTGFRHSSIPTAEKVIGELAQQSGAFTVDYARVENNAPGFKGADGKPDKAKYEPAVKAVLAEKMSAAALKNYDAVIFANTTGDLPLPDPQAFLDWIKSGKGFVGVHSATDTFHGFAPFIEMIGGEFKTHGAQVSVDAINQDPACAACRHLPASWTVFDEIYQLKNFDRTKVHGLLTLDKHPNDKTPGDYPIAWIKEYGQGRVFYTSLGHREDVWEPNSPAQKGGIKNTPEVALAYQQHLLGGIKWALGLEKGDAKAQVSK